VHTCVYLCRCESVTSTYLMVRAGLCPYVYVCCHHMTLMFRAAGVGRHQLHAVLTPTTRGIRAALDNDGKLSVSVAIMFSACPSVCACVGRVSCTPSSLPQHTPSEQLLTVIASDSLLLFCSCLFCESFRHRCLQCFDAVGWVAGRASGL